MEVIGCVDVQRDVFVVSVGKVEYRVSQQAKVEKWQTWAGEIVSGEFVPRRRLYNIIDAGPWLRKNISDAVAEVYNRGDMNRFRHLAIGKYNDLFDEATLIKIASMISDEEIKKMQANIDRWNTEKNEQEFFKSSDDIGFSWNHDDD